MNKTQISIRLPGEWETHDACWLAWPYDNGDWHDLALVQEEFVNFCRAIQHTKGSEILHVLIPKSERIRVTEALVGLHVRFFDIPYGDVWLRDTGPLFVRRGQELIAKCFSFNGWGQKYMYPGDEKVSAAVARRVDVAPQPVPWILEGGSVESNGQGAALLTEQCLLNPNRNPNATKQGVEQILREHLGICQPIWLQTGLVGDHTDGHIDNLARFVDPRTIVCAEPQQADDPHRDVLREVIEVLKSATDTQGRPFEIMTIPSVGRMEDPIEGILPATYLNFYIGNTSVCVPTYGKPQDSVAIKQLQTCFPKRKVIGVAANHILTGGGALHCMSQPQPAVEQ